MERNKYKQLLLICLAVMIGLTILSRAADSFVVAKVNVEKARQGTLVHKTDIEGKIDAVNKHYLPSKVALRVENIHVGEGNKVQKGDMLFSLNLEEVREKAEALTDELSVLDLEIKELSLKRGGSAQDKFTLESAEEELRRALSDDAFNKSINDGQQMLADKRKIADAEQKVAAAKRSMNEYGVQQDVEWQRKENSRKEKGKEYEELKKILNNEGNVVADISGMVGEIFAKQGEVLSGGNYCTIIPEGTDYIFTGEIGEKEAKYLQTGDKASLLPTGKSVPVEGALITSLATNEDKVKVTAQIPSSPQLKFGTQATLTHEKRSEEYKAVVPLSAVRSTQGKYFVYVIDETNGILGKQKVARKEEVEVLEKDNRYAALSKAPGSEQSVIVKSNKSITEGDRVREQGEEIREKE